CGQRSDDGQSRTWCSALGLASQFRGYLRQDSGPRSWPTSGRTVNLGEQLDSGQSATPIITGAVRNSSIKTSAAEAAFASGQNSLPYHLNWKGLHSISHQTNGVRNDRSCCN